jgi:hypothetical protein
MASREKSSSEAASEGEVKVGLEWWSWSLVKEPKVGRFGVERE